jgi:uncharacterized membrane protein (DUF485 family)
MEITLTKGLFLLFILVVGALLVYLSIRNQKITGVIYKLDPITEYLDSSKLKATIKYPVIIGDSTCVALTSPPLTSSPMPPASSMEPQSLESTFSPNPIPPPYSQCESLPQSFVKIMKKNKCYVGQNVILHYRFKWLKNKLSGKNLGKINILMMIIGCVLILLFILTLIYVRNF